MFHPVGVDVDSYYTLFLFWLQIFGVYTTLLVVTALIVIYILRKRRSSILKNQRCVRAPLSELEFNVATPDQAKSRRVSFSRRTGVAEFEITEATTAWKNVYEQHNKSLESSANESGLKAAPRRVGHLGARASHFEDEEADVVDATEPRAPPTAQLDELPTNTNTIQLFRLELNPGLRELTDNLDVDFSAMAPPADDLEALRRDLEREPKRANISDVSIDVDFNATHFSLKVDDDDMSITDTIRSPAVAATKKQVDDWTVDKENIVVNPYIAPPPAEFPCEDDILVFDGKKCKFQSKLDLSDAPLESETENIPPKTVFLDDMTETQAVPVQIIRDKSVLNTERRKTVVFGDDGDMSVTQAVADNIIAPRASQEDKENQKTMYFDDLPDMSVTQALPADIIQSEPERKTILYEDDAHISMTEAVPARILTGSEHLPLENLENKTTIVYEDADVSMTGVVSGNEVKGSADRRKTLVYGNDGGNVSITGVLPANLIDEVKIQSNVDQRKTIVFGDKDGHVSMTGVLPENIIDAAKLVPPNTERRKTIVYGNDNGNLSVTGVLPTNIIDEAKLTQLNTDRRRTVVFRNGDGNLSMTGVAPVSILDGAKVTQEPNTDRRKTIVYNNDDGNVSMTGVLPANIIDEAKVRQSMDHRKTVVFGNYDGNLSMTGVAPVSILSGAKYPNADRRKTIVYENDGGNISMTGVVLANILDGAKETQELNTDPRKTIVYNNDNGNVSVTGVVPVNIIDVAKETQESTADRRKPIVYGNDEGNISVTGVVPVNILDEAKQLPTDHRKTVGNGKDDGNMSKTGVLPPNILDDGAKMQPVNAKRRQTVVYDEDNGNLSMTGVAPINILDGANKQNIEDKTVVYSTDSGHLSLTAAESEIFEDAKEQLVEQENEPDTEHRKTVVFGDDDNNVSITGMIPANIEEDAKLIPSLNEERGKTIVYGNEDGNVSATGVTQENMIQQPETNRKSIAHGVNDGNMSIIGVLLANMLDEEDAVKITSNRRKTVVYEDDDANMSITGVVPNIIGVEKSTQAPYERRQTVVYENDVSMTDIVPANIMPEDTNIIVPETPTSIICENTETQQNELEVFYVKDEQVEMIEAVTIPKLIESDEEGDVSMTQADGPQSLNNLCPATFNKLSANQDITSLNKSQLDPHSATFNKSLANQELAANKSLAGQESATFESTVNKTFTAHSMSMNKTLTSNVLVYGATTERDAKDGDNSYIVEGLNLEDNQSQESPNASLGLSKSFTEQLARSRVQAVMTPPKESILDVLLDMSQASGEDIWNKPQSSTVTGPVSDITMTDSVPTSESYILVKDEGPDGPALEATEPVQYKKPKHGIVCNLQRKLNELKDTLLVKQKSPKRDKNKSENQDLTHNTSNLGTSKITNSSEGSKSPKNCLNSTSSDLDPPKSNESLEKSKLLKPSLNSPSSPNKDCQEKNKSLKIDLTSEMFIRDKKESPVDNQIQVDLTSIEDKEMTPIEDEERANTTKCQANDTKAILDALSDFTNTRRSGDFEPAPNRDRPKRSSAPDRKSMPVSMEDLLREISTAQALMKTETAQTEIDLDATEDSSDDQASPLRLSREVVKTLRFEDDDSILESKVLQKPISSDSPPPRTSSVIPTYEISDPVKELMKDLIKPLADVERPVRSEPCQSSQANRFDSSQIDLIPAKPFLVSPHSCLRKEKEALEPRKEPEPVIVFDPSNPLNNVVIPPLDRAVVHKYNPVQSGHSMSPSTPSVESECCQTESEALSRNMDVGVVLVKPAVERGVASRSKLGAGAVDRATATHASVKDCEVNTSIVMKDNRELLADSSSLTLVDDALSRSPVRVIFKLDEPYSSVVLDSDLSSVHDSEHGRKRGHVAAKGPELDEPYSSVVLDSDLSSVHDSEHGRKRGHVAAKGPELDEPYSSVVLDSDLSSVHDSEHGRKRGHVAAKGPELDEPYSSVVLDSDLSSVHDSEHGRKRGHVAAKGPELDEPYSSVVLDSDLSSVHDSEHGRKRGHVAAKGPELDEPYSSVVLDSDLSSVHDSEHGRKRGHVAAKGPELDEPYSSVVLDSDLSSVHDSEHGRKRGHVAAKGPELDEPYSSVVLDSDLSSVHDSEHGRKRGHVAAKGPELDEPYSSVVLDSDLSSVHDSEHGRKRGHVAAKGPELDEPYSSVVLDSDLSSVHDSEHGRKRGHVAAKGPELDEPYSSVVLDSDVSSVHDSEHGRKRGHVAAKGPELDEPYSSVVLDSDLSSVHDSEHGRKRGHVAAKGPELDEPYSSVVLDSDLSSVHDSEHGRKRGHVAAKGPELDEPYSSVVLDSDLSSVHDSEHGRKRGHVAAKGPELDEPYSSVVLDSDLSSVHDSEHGRKRGHVAAKGPKVTPKPALKVQKVSNSTKVSRRQRNQSKGKEIIESSQSSRDSSVTVAQLYACARSVASASATDSRCSRVSDWRPELLHEASSKNLVSEQESGVNVVAKIDVLPFMGTYECEWESRAADTWSFRLLRARLRLVIRLEHRATNNTRVLVRADTPVRLVTVQHATVDQERAEPVAALCLCLAAGALQRVCARGVARAGAVPALLRRCAAIARVALHWGRCMRKASAALAFSLSEDGCLSLKVANIPLRSVWEVTLRIELCEDERGGARPLAADVAVRAVVAAWAPARAELHAALAPVPRDWGHVPRTVWKIFKYLKNKTPENDLFIV
ncbi:uncharacterized protein LOC134659851 [Cydia amplana]|uniref:uncharacterized protein LOC134659851 n=1 Tax=Cydia amplana TaxID=1869771 RepID=UPI002FE66153